MLLPAALAVLAVGGEPQCPVSMSSCYFTYSNSQFGNPWLDIDFAGVPYNETIVGEAKTHGCSRYNWLMADQCNSNCPLRLRITRPAELAMTVCVQDNVFAPYQPDGHVDLNHPLNGQELELVAAGSPGVTRHGCEMSDFTDKDYTGKMVLIQRGTCYFFQKFERAAAMKAAAGLMVNSRTMNSIYGQMFSMSGPSTGIEQLPAAMVPRQFGDALFEALDEGVKVYGKYELNCDPMPEPTAEDLELFDGCPTGKLEEVCLDAAAEEDRLCAACPLALNVSGAVGCLRGNDLLPRQKKNSLRFTLDALPSTTGTDDIFWAEDMEGGGCMTADFTGLAGKIVMMKNPQACVHFTAARYASKAGVKALVNYEVQVGQLHTAITGSSALVTMPVHSLNADDSIALWAAVQKVGRPAAFGNTTGYFFGGTFATGPTRARREVDDSVAIVIAEAAAPESIAEFDWSPTVVVCLILIIIFFVLLVVLYLHQRANAVDIPAADGKSEGFAMPLGLANMGLALSLLVIIAVVAFSLAYAAGQDATDTAVADGNKAASVTYENAVGNVDELARNLRETVIGKVEQEVRATLEKGEAAANGAAQIYSSFDGNWASFAAMLDIYVSYAASLDADNWLTQIFTNRGFMASVNVITDSRPDDERNDGVVGTVADTNKGWLYGTSRIYWVPSEFMYEFWANTDKLQYNASRTLGGALGDPLAVVADAPRGMYKWHITRETFPNIEEYYVHPISVFTPLYSRTNDVMGTVEARTELTILGSILSTAAAGEGLQNLTLVLIDPADKSVIATNAWNNVKMRGSVFKVGFMEMRGYFTLYDLPPVHVSAMANYVDTQLGKGMWELPESKTPGRAAGFSGKFDQADHYNGSPLRVMRLRAVNGAAADIGGDAWDVDMRDGACGACVGADTNGDAVMDFDGKTILYVKQNLTVRVPRVAETKVETPDGSWASSKEEYSMIYTNGGDECVGYEDRVDATTATTNCLLRDNFLLSRGSSDEGYTVHMRIKPRVTYNETQWTSTTPHLFTDRILGETNMRLFANGQMNLLILGYGCKTPAPAGGIPANVWTTITATRSPYYCRVYINGTLAGEGRVSSSYGAYEYGEAFVVGRYYSGLMDNVTVYNYSATPTEVAGMHASGGNLAREVPSREWFVDVRSLDANVAQRRSGVAWQVVAMLPRDDVMRQVDRNNQITMRNLRIQEDNTQKRLTQKSNETIMIVVLIAMVSVFIFLVFNDALTKPFAQTAIVMTDAAVMRIEQVDEKHSFLLELNAMNRAMALMCKNLKEYKSYMPQTLGFDDEDDDAMGSTDGTESEHSKSGRGSKTASRSRRSGQSMASFMSKSAAASQAVENVAAANEKRRGLVLALQRKKISFCINNISGWFEGIHGLSDTAVVALHGEVVSMTLQAFNLNKGVSEVFSGDRFVASFNAAKNCGTHRVSCVSAAVQIHHAFMAAHGDKFRIHAACVSGDGRVGNCGNDQMKKFTFMTPVLTWGYGLERVAKSVDIPVLADSYVYDDAQNMFQLKIVMDVVFAKRNKSRSVRVAEIVDKKESGETDEWMYELEEAAAKDPYHVFNRFAEAVLGQDWETAQGLSNDAKTVDSGRIYTRLSEQLSAQAVKPLELLFH